MYNACIQNIVLRIGVDGENVLALSNRLLAKYGGLAGLARTPSTDLQGEHGLGEAKVATLKAAFELGRRLTIASPEDKVQVRYTVCKDWLYDCRPSSGRQSRTANG